jgi:hypothetical protein
MDLTNRALIIGYALLLILLASIVIFLAWGAPDQSIERLSDLAGYLDDHNNNAAKVLVTLGGLIVVLIGLLVIIYEVLPPETGSVRLQHVSNGQADIAVEEVVQRLESELRALPQLADAQATITGRGRKAEVNLDLYVTPDADLASTSEEACRVARELMEGRMGLQLDGQPRAQVHYRELRVGGPVDAPHAMQPIEEPAQVRETHEAAETSHQDQPASS